MADTANVFAGAIPELYDRYLGPVLFQPYAEDLARRVAEHADSAVLETACGTGILTRELRRHLAPDVRLVATDLNPLMINHAQALEDSASQVEWQQADCTALPFPPASFSAVACQFGLMFPQDKHAALLEARRVLVDGGLLIFNVWDSLAHNPFIQVIQETIVSFFPTDPPRFFDRPYAFHDTRDWKDLLSASGFTDQRHEVVTLEARSPTAEQFAYGQICGSPLGQEIRERGGSMERILEAVTAALVRQGGEAPFTSSMQALVISARASASGHAADWVSDQV